MKKEDLCLGCMTEDYPTAFREGDIQEDKGRPARRKACASGKRKGNGDCGAKPAGEA